MASDALSALLIDHRESGACVLPDARAWALAHGALRGAARDARARRLACAALRAAVGGAAAASPPPPPAAAAAWDALVTLLEAAADQPLHSLSALWALRERDLHGAGAAGGAEGGAGAGNDGDDGDGDGGGGDDGDGGGGDDGDGDTAAAAAAAAAAADAADAASADVTEPAPGVPSLFEPPPPAWALLALEALVEHENPATARAFQLLMLREAARSRVEPPLADAVLSVADLGGAM